MCRASRDTERTACGHVGKGRVGQLRAALTYLHPRVRQRAREGLPAAQELNAGGSVTTQMGGAAQEGTRVLVAIHVAGWQKPMQYCKAITLQ